MTKILLAMVGFLFGSDGLLHFDNLFLRFNLHLFRLGLFDFGRVVLSCNFESSNKNNLKQKTTMKKTINKITLKTDKIVSLTKTQAKQLVGGAISVYSGFVTCNNCPD
ncbi:MAG: class I lanthipeptide [Spirosomataceae bacterium]